jgi:hypothetical protein
MVYPVLRDHLPPGSVPVASDFIFKHILWEHVEAAYLYQHSKMQSAAGAPSLTHAAVDLTERSKMSETLCFAVLDERVFALMTEAFSVKFVDERTGLVMSDPTGTIAYLRDLLVVREALMPTTQGYINADDARLRAAEAVLKKWLVFERVIADHFNFQPLNERKKRWISETSLKELVCTMQGLRQYLDQVAAQARSLREAQGLDPNDVPRMRPPNQNR